MNYQETIDYLFSRLPMFSRVGAAAYKPSLDNTIRLCNSLGNPELKFKSIHVAGTNGKGSVSHMLAAIFQTAGYKTGLYTSPHLKDFRERIRIDGNMIPEQVVIDFTERTRTLAEEIEPSFFEITVAMAFDHFASEKTDIAIIETGLGGRLDSTNIITPELSIITNIGWDHMNLLGDSLEKIAAEKAGIIKTAVPVIIGETNAVTQPIFEKATAEKNAVISFADTKRTAADWNWHQHHLQVQVAEKDRADHRQYALDLHGLYQTKNLLTVLEACAILKEQGWHIEEADLQMGLAHVKRLTGLHGRWETIHNSPLVILDVAHNEDGMKQLVQQLELSRYHNLHIIIGMVKDKEIEKVLSLLPSQAAYYFTRSRVPRAMPEEELMRRAAVYGLNGKAWPNVDTALKQAMSNARPDDMILVCGSVFLVGEVTPPAH